MASGNHLKETRLNLNLTQQEVAWHADIAESYYQRLEYGDSVPTLGVARAIAKVLQADVDALWPDHQVAVGE